MNETEKNQGGQGVCGVVLAVCVAKLSILSHGTQSRDGISEQIFFEPQDWQGENERQKTWLVRGSGGKWEWEEWTWKKFATVRGRRE